MSQATDLSTDRKLVACQRFSTEGLSPQEQFEAWSAFAATSVDPGTGTDPKMGFEASADCYSLGSMTLTSFKMAPMKFRYSRDVIRKSTHDPWCIATITKGLATSQGEHSGLQARAGSTILHSYAQPFAGELEAIEYTAVYFSRDEFWDIADPMDKLSQQQIIGPMSQIVADFLVSIEGRAKNLSVPEAAAVNDAFAHLLRAMVNSSSDTAELAKSSVAAAQFERARRFINENLRSPTLTPDAVCKSLGISRRQLFYLFERYEGVAKYIKNRRLAACYSVLTKASQKRMISSVAYEFGYTNVSSFTRQFQERYGFSPSEAQSAWLDGNRVSFSEGNRLIDWLIDNSGA
ncbi:helix-turn-helix domain-containing protein [Roseibium sp.]|uniref:helix-turn-helix domain-containing protein n=1 Tax=Roseibium sp. TaxID=1936156 RepID=UPI003A9802BE